MTSHPPAISNPRSPSLLQQRYQADPEGCSAKIESRASRLYEDGYIAVTGHAPLVFKVHHGERGTDPRDGAACYYVHAVRKTCSCPFYCRQVVEPLSSDGSMVPCKHVRGLEVLIRKSVTHFREARDFYQYLRLLSQWMAVLAEEHRSPAAGTVSVLRQEAQKGNVK